MAKITNQQIFDEVIRLSELIEGDPDDRLDDGVMGDVKENTAFRKSMQRMFWYIFIAMLSGNMPIIYFGSKFLIKKLTGEI